MSITAKRVDLASDRPEIELFSWYLLAVTSDKLFKLTVF